MRAGVSVFVFVIFKNGVFFVGSGKRLRNVFQLFAVFGIVTEKNTLLGRVKFFVIAVHFINVYFFERSAARESGNFNAVGSNVTGIYV